jgi:predicted secreted hydrolase
MSIVGLLTLALVAGCPNVTIPYREEDHGSFEDEFAPHENAHGWWYITGYATDVNDPTRLYAFQFTQIYVNDIPLIPDVYALQLNFADMNTGEDLFRGSISLSGPGAYANDQEVVFQTESCLTRTAEGMDFFGNLDGAEMDLHFDFGKGGVWHGDDGVLVMGTPDDPDQRTVYYSYTNMPTTGRISVLNEAGETVNVQVEGKAWLDRQWGPYRLTDTQSFWEWFSLRFFDDDEVMLFAFPQHAYQDGTYVRADGSSQRLLDYTYTPTDYVEKDGKCYSFGWDLTLPGVKEQHYRVEPMLDDRHQYHWNYFELMARILNDNNDLVGYAFVELLPGLREGMCGE